MKKTPSIAKCIDHTFLKPTGEKRAIASLCREARKHGFASVCVNPCEVKKAAKLLKGCKVAVCTVIGFPLGASTTTTKMFEAMDALENGADELDIVINQQMLKHDLKSCVLEVRAIAAVCRERKKDVVLKLILECCNLTREEIVRGCKLARVSGFDFVKTSTGFGSGGATIEDVKLMRKTVGKKMGVKAAGGIRDRATALAMIAAGATRLGTSAGKALLK